MRWGVEGGARKGVGKCWGRRKSLLMEMNFVEGGSLY